MSGSWRPGLCPISATEATSSGTTRMRSRSSSEPQRRGGGADACRPLLTCGPRKEPARGPYRPGVAQAARPESKSSVTPWLTRWTTKPSAIFEQSRAARVCIRARTSSGRHAAASACRREKPYSLLEPGARRAPSGASRQESGLPRLRPRARRLGRQPGSTRRLPRARLLGRQRPSRVFQTLAFFTATAHRRVLSLRLQAAAAWSLARAGTRRPRARATRAAPRASGATRRTRTALRPRR